METQERMNEPANPTPAPAVNSGGNDNLGAIRRQADDLLAAGRAAINRVLSHNSEQFLTANRQAGGQ
jgi:hypothetical protein